MAKNNYWSPYIAGAGIGLTLLATFYVAGWGLGASSAFSLLAGIGSLLFAVAFPELEGFYHSSAMGEATIHGLLGISHWLVLAVLLLAAGLMFYFIERYEKRTG